jgi:hypothetical protein
MHSDLRSFRRLLAVGCLLASGVGLAQPVTRSETPAPAPGPCREGFQEMEVLGLMPSEQGQAVVLKHPRERLLLPIWIGPAEAFVIQLRLERKRFQRPLTHDLLDDAVQKLGGRITLVQVDDLKDNTYVGTVFLQQGGRALQLDARPSDAIALALGNRAPICVSSSVLENAGVRGEQAPPGAADPPAAEPAAPEKKLREILDALPGGKSL